jgi:hypothetical protein
MATTYRYIEAASVFVTVWDGKVTAAEWADVARRQVVDPNWSRAKRRLTDARTADTSAITDDDANEISTVYMRDNAEFAGVRIAFVANHSRDVAQLVERALAGNGVTTIVFYDLDTASAWLDVDTQVVSATVHDLRQELRRPQ